MQTLRLRCYDRKAHKTFRTPRDVEEMAAHCAKHSHIWFKSYDGSARQAKVNGQVRRWKRDPDRIEVPVKYGLYEYGVFGKTDIEKVLIPVEPAANDIELAIVEPGDPTLVIIE